MPFITRKTITETFLERVKETPSAPGFQYKTGSGEKGEAPQWKVLTFKEFYSECRLLSFGLMSLGIKKGDRVAILSNTRFEWSLSDMAILGAGAVTVPIYASNTSDDVAYIANHAEARILILEDLKQLQKVFEKQAKDPQAFGFLEKIVIVDPTAVFAKSFATTYPEGLKKVVTLQALQELGRREEAKDPALFDSHLKSASSNDLITICYTSGTTGVPKGVMLTHDNLMSVLEDCVKTLGPFVRPEKEVVLSFLPFSHIFGKVESLALYTFGWKAAYAESIDQLMVNMGEVRPTLVFAVPRVFEKAYNRLNTLIEGGSATKKMLFQWAFRVGRDYYGAIWNKKSPSLSARLQYEAASRIVFSKVVQRFGGRLRFAACGGAPLSQAMGEFFQIAGIKILEGYGLTETCAPVTLNLPDDPRFGAVGRPLPEVSIKIAEDGEVLVKSRKVFKGYYKMEGETQTVMADGWFHTGDIGHLDADGFLHITDRKKDLIVTSGGKNIAPQKIENIAKTKSLINQFVVHGDRRNYLTALVVLEQEQVVRYAKENQILFSGYNELVKNPKIITLVQKVVDEINAHLASYETVKKFVILPDEFTIEGGELTPSMKIRRNFIVKRYKAILDSMYTESATESLD